MSVEELIEILRKAKPTDIVKAFDPEMESTQPVTGVVYDGHDGVVELYTNEP